MCDIPNNSPLDQLEVFWTELSPMRAAVFAQLAMPEGTTGWRLSGFIRGPRSQRHQTLPSTVQLVDAGPGATLLARAVVPEPSLWSPESPNIYEVTIDLQRDGQQAISVQRQLGFRSIRCSEHYLLREGKPWIPRGVLAESCDQLDLAAARETGAVVVLREPDERLLQEASQQGAYLAVRLTGDVESLRTQLRHLSNWPAVAIAVVSAPEAAIQDLRSAAPNLILAVETSGDSPVANASSAQVRWLKADASSAALRSACLGRTVLVCRPLAKAESLAAARAACDILQRDLASAGQFAGYFV